MSAVIRPATADDASILARLKQDVWPDDTADPAEIASAIQNPHHASHIAFMDDKPAGFVDGFTTTAANGVLRWEVDLLGVTPPFRGRGIAAKLIEANTAVAETRSVAFSRALIRTGNVASERAFAQADYSTDGVVYALYVKESFAGAYAGKPDSAHLIPVYTFGYSGVWLEGEITKEGISAARSYSGALGGQIVGAVISRDNAAAIWTAQAAGCDFLADFLWWRRDLTQS